MPVLQILQMAWPWPHGKHLSTPGPPWLPYQTSAFTGPISPCPTLLAPGSLQVTLQGAASTHTASPGWLPLCALYLDFSLRALPTFAQCRQLPQDRDHVSPMHHHSLLLTTALYMGAAHKYHRVHEQMDK